MLVDISAAAVLVLVGRVRVLALVKVLVEAVMPTAAMVLLKARKTFPVEEQCNSTRVPGREAMCTGEGLSQTSTSSDLSPLSMAR